MTKIHFSKFGYLYMVHTHHMMPSNFQFRWVEVSQYLFIPIMCHRLVVFFFSKWRCTVLYCTNYYFSVISVLCTIISTVHDKFYFSVIIVQYGVISVHFLCTQNYYFSVISVLCTIISTVHNKFYFSVIIVQYGVILVHFLCRQKKILKNFVWKLVCTFFFDFTGCTL